MSDRVFSYLTERRDNIEKSLKSWVDRPSRSDDPVAVNMAINELAAQFGEIKLKLNPDYSKNGIVSTWETSAGFDDGTLFIGHLDVPAGSGMPRLSFRRGSDHMYGTGIGTSRAPLVMLQSVLRALRTLRVLHRMPIGVLYYFAEGRDCAYSANTITEAASRAKRIFVLRPGNFENKLIIQRRGQRKYQLTVHGIPQRLGQKIKLSDPMTWLCNKISTLSSLSSRQERIAVRAVDITTESYPQLLPHSASATLVMGYPDEKRAAQLEGEIRSILDGKGVNYSLEVVSDRPPMINRTINRHLAREMISTGSKWEIDLDTDSSLLPSVAGLVPSSVPVVCGVGPVARHINTPDEAVLRITLIQRALVLAQYLLDIDSD